EMFFRDGRSGVGDELFQNRGSLRREPDFALAGPEPRGRDVESEFLAKADVLIHRRWALVGTRRNPGKLPARSRDLRWVRCVSCHTSREAKTLAHCRRVTYESLIRHTR